MKDLEFRTVIRDGKPVRVMREKYPEGDYSEWVEVSRIEKKKRTHKRCKDTPDMFEDRLFK